MKSNFRTWLNFSPCCSNTNRLLNVAFESEFFADVLRSFWENPVGIITVGVAVGFYFIFFIYARRKDKLNKLKVRYIPGSDLGLGRG